MPELPEVETIARSLRGGGRNGPPVVTRRIYRAHLLWEGVVADPSPGEFLTRIPGQEIKEIRRRGKFLLFTLTRDAMLIHLRMSGDLIAEAVDTPPAPHHRMILDLEGHLRLSFNDPRKFGRVWLVADPQEVLQGLGPEPLDPSFTPEDLHRRLTSHRRQLKPLLIDQAFLAGLGNIYADEALHLAKLHPLTISNTLTLPQAKRLWESIRQVLEVGIQSNGASIDWVYRGGDFQNHFQVYQRSGKPCYECGTSIQRLVVGQRGTHICSSCQPPPAC